MREALGMPDMPLFKGGQSTLTASHMSHSREPQFLYILNVHKAGRVPTYCITKHDSVHVSPFKAMEILLIRPSLKAMAMLLILVTQISR